MAVSNFTVIDGFRENSQVLWFPRNNPKLFRLNGSFQSVFGFEFTDIPSGGIRICYNKIIIINCYYICLTRDRNLYYFLIGIIKPNNKSKKI